MPDVSANPSLASSGCALPADLAPRVTAAVDSSRDELIALVEGTKALALAMIAWSGLDAGS